MHRRHTFIKDGFLTITVVGVFCFLFLIASAYQGETRTTEDQLLLTLPEHEPEVLPPSNQIHNTVIVNVPVPESTLFYAENDTETEPHEIEKEDTESETIFIEPVVVDTEVAVKKVFENTRVTKKKVAVNTKAIEKDVVVNTIETEVVALPKVVIDTKPPVTNAHKELIQSESSDSDYINEIIKLIAQETNAFRTDHDVHPLQYDRTLERNAQNYSVVMQTGKFLSHTDTDGCGLTCRFTRDAYNATAWGENLATMSFQRRRSAEEVASFFMTQWQKSAGHRENLISPFFTDQGIGVAVSPTSIYVTVQFAKPK